MFSHVVALVESVGWFAFLTPSKESAMLRRQMDCVRLFAVEFAHLRTPWLTNAAYRLFPTWANRALGEAMAFEVFGEYHYARRLLNGQRV